MSKKRIISQDTTEPSEDFSTDTPEDIAQDLSVIREELGITDEEGVEPYSTLEVITDDFGHRDELTLADSNDNLYSIYLSPDGSGVIVQPITLSVKRHPHKLFPADENGVMPWRQIDREIFPSGFTEIDVGDNYTTASGQTPNWKRIVSNLLKDVSYRKEYSATVKYNPYVSTY